MENESDVLECDGSKATSKSDERHRRAIYLFVLGLIAFATANIGISIVANRLNLERERLQAKYVYQSERLNELAQWHARASKVNFQVHAEREYLKSSLKQCGSRDDFLVRDGEHIAYATVLVNGTENRETFFYLPKGGHRLNIVCKHFSNPNALANSFLDFRDADPQSLNPTRISLQGDEVYAMRFIRRKDEKTEIVVIGKDNVEVYRNVFNVFGKTRFPASRTADVLFPNQYSRYRGLGPQPAPIVDLFSTLATVSKNKVDVLRVWIDSDAKPCIPAVSIAVKYPKLPFLVGVPGAKSREPLNEYFEPYLGSGKYFFRESTFPLPGIVNTGIQFQKQVQ